MTLEKLNAIFEAAKPEGYNYYAYKYMGQYNKEKDVQNALVFVYPRNWPLLEFDSISVDLEFRFGKVLPIDSGYSPTTTVSELEDEARAFFARINSHSDFLRIDDVSTSFEDAPEGSSVNWQAWLICKIKAKVWYCDYAPIGSFISEDGYAYFIAEKY